MLEIGMLKYLLKRMQGYMLFLNCQFPDQLYNLTLVRIITIDKPLNQLL